VLFKLDAKATWPSALVDEVAATGAVDTIDFKGQYGLEDPPGDLPASPLTPRPEATGFR
jgi:hypothetical protein